MNECSIDNLAGLALLTQLHIAPKSIRKRIVDEFGERKLLSKLSGEDKKIGKYLLLRKGSAKTKHAAQQYIKAVKLTDKTLEP